MGIITGISWSDATWNPWHGCEKVSPGCKYCYMFRDKERFGQDPTDVIRSKGNFKDPLSWHKNGKQTADDGALILYNSFKGMKIFTCSWSDWFIEEADEWRAEAWEVIKATPDFVYQILTKRPDRIQQCLPPDWGEGYDNVWLGVSGENQDRTTERLTILKDIPAHIKWLSAEPLIGPIDLDEIHEHHLDVWECLDWIVIGGESGNETGPYKYRPCEEGWIDDIIDDAKTYNIPIHMKQFGTHLAKEFQFKHRHGANPEEWIEEYQIQDFPFAYQQKSKA